MVKASIYSFSPLAGIRYVETVEAAISLRVEVCFSPLAGIRYVETTLVIAEFWLLI